ncbi:MAG: hypothetical protein QM725_06140 [Lacibacter sp.]
MKSKLLLSLTIFTFCFCKAQDNKWFIGNTAVFSLGVNQGDYGTMLYKGEPWSLIHDSKNLSIEYQINGGKLFKPLSKSYSGFFESGLRIGYQAGKISNGNLITNYNESYVGLPLIFGLVRKEKHRIIAHSLGLTLYGAFLKEIKGQSTDRKWDFFSQPRGMFSLNTQLFFPSKKTGRYYGVGFELSRDIGFKYKPTKIPFVIENMRFGITVTPFNDFSN